MDWKPFKLSEILDEKTFDKTKYYLLCHYDRVQGLYYHCVWWSNNLSDWTNGHGVYDEGDFFWFQWYCEIEAPGDYKKW